MAKITRKKYEARKKAISDALGHVAKAVDILTAAEQFDGLNALHDAEYELVREAKFLEMEWSRRNWNGSDRALSDLVASNVD